MTTRRWLFTALVAAVLIASSAAGWFLSGDGIRAAGFLVLTPLAAALGGAALEEYVPRRSA